MLATLQAAPADVRRPFDAGERPPASPIDAVQTQRLALWALSALDRLDQGIVLLTPDARVCFANRSARDAIQQCDGLALSCGTLQATLPDDRVRLREALRAACERGQLRMLRLGCGAQAHYLTLAPIAPVVPGMPMDPVLGLLGRSSLCNPLALQWFAQCHALTGAESEVLRLLSEGHDPREIARRQGVALSTVRTQIGSVRAKAGQESIRSLIDALGRLPLIRSVLSGWCQAAG